MNNYADPDPIHNVVIFVCESKDCHPIHYIVTFMKLIVSVRSSSLIQFFDKMKKWADMANLPKDFRDKVDRLERNFAVSTVIFKKFEPIFLDIFRSPSDDPPRVQRSRKQRYNGYTMLAREKVSM